MGHFFRGGGVLPCLPNYKRICIRTLLWIGILRGDTWHWELLGAAIGYTGREGHLCADGRSHQPGKEGKWNRTRQQGSGTQHSISQVPSWPCHGRSPPFSSVFIRKSFFLSHRDRNLSSRHGKCQGSCPSFSLNVCQTRDKVLWLEGGDEGARKAA